jgi:hypothetical protein
VAYKFFPLEDQAEHMRSQWKDGLPQLFHWKRKIKRFLTNQLYFLGFTAFWVGCWDIFDLLTFEYSMRRYVSIVIYRIR